MLLPTPREIKSLFPVSLKQKQFILSSQKQAQEFFTSKSRPFLIIAGPCSIHDLNSARAYAERLSTLSKKVKNTCFLIMRVYMEKPRTTIGWKGLLYDPFLDGSNQIQEGLYLTRQLLLDLAEMEIPVATEFVDPLTALYFEDLITWGFIGARTSASQTHRQLASYLKMPIGFKNSTDGNLDNAIQGVIAAQNSHAFMHMNEDGKLCILKSDGNPLTHIVLRGSHFDTNYDPESVQGAIEKLVLSELSPHLLIDCSHGNCQKEYKRQKLVFESIIAQKENGNDNIFGVMLESHLEEGNQLLDSSDIRSDVSITDPCIDWSLTEELICSADERLWATSSLCSSS